jgi:hypothetical protein
MCGFRFRLRMEFYTSGCDRLRTFIHLQALSLQYYERRDDGS